MTKYAGKKVLVRGIQSGVYYGTLIEQEKQEVELKNARNIWYWEGANNLHDLAENGVSKPDNCKFSNEVESLVLTDVCEIIPCSEKAIKIIEGVKEWIF